MINLLRGFVIFFEIILNKLKKKWMMGFNQNKGIGKYVWLTHAKY